MPLTCSSGSNSRLTTSAALPHMHSPYCMLHTRTHSAHHSHTNPAHATRTPMCWLAPAVLRGDRLSCSRHHIPTIPRTQTSPVAAAAPHTTHPPRLQLQQTCRGGILLAHHTTPHTHGHCCSVPPAVAAAALQGFRRPPNPEPRPHCPPAHCHTQSVWTHHTTPCPPPPHTHTTHRTHPHSHQLPHVLVVAPTLPEALHPVLRRSSAHLALLLSYLHRQTQQHTHMLVSVLPCRQQYPP